MTAETFPLTARQMLIWLGHQRAEGLPGDNMVMTYAVSGEVDPERFAAAFATVVRECRALRTVVADRDGEPLQVALDPDAHEPAHTFHDVSRAADPEAEAEKLRAAAGAQVFDIERCNYGSVLIRVSPQRSIWVHVQHHLICDGASCALVFEHVARRYAGAGHEPVADYALYLEQEARYRASKAAKRDAEFWKPRLSRTVEPQGGYGPAFPVAGTVHRRVERRLGAERTARVREACQKPPFRSLSASLAGSVLFETVLFAHMRRVRGDVTLAVGAPLHNRDSRKTKDVVGCMIEVAPFGVHVELEDSFEAIYARLMEETVTVLKRARHAVPNAARKPVFDVMYNFHTARFPDFAGMPSETRFETGLNFHRASAEVLDPHTISGETLVVQVHDFDGSGELRVTFDFHAAHFPRERDGEIADHFVRLLDALLDDPSQAIGDVDLISAAEREELIERINPARQPMSERPGVLQQLAAQRTQRPEQIAVRCGDRELSYAQLDARSTCLAQVLRGIGVAPGVRVALAMERDADLVTALLGVLKAGGAYVPLDPGHPPSRNSVVLEDAEPRVLLTQTPLRDLLTVPDDCEIVCIDALDLDAAPSGEEAPLEPPTHEQLAYVIFTSGSTGRPKGVRVRHGELANFLMSMAHTPGLSEGEGLLAVTTISFDIAALEIFLPLCVGGWVQLTDKHSSGDPDALMALLARGDIQVLQATPATFRMLLDAGWEGTAGLRVLCGGEALPEPLVAPLLERTEALWNMYGPTETTIWSSVQQIRTGDPCITIGSPIDNTEMYVVDDQQRLLPPGVAGELVIGGLGVTEGYHERPELTADRFVADPYRDGRLYRTGDLARVLPNRQLQCLGRLDFQVKIRGFRIEVGEIETALAGQPGVSQAVVVAREHSPGDNRLVAFVVPSDPGAKLDMGELRGALRDALPHYMVPAAFMQLATLPKTPNDKIDRKALPEVELEAAASVSAEVPETDFEHGVAALFAEILGVPGAGRGDNFFDLGGDSLSLVRLHRGLSNLSDTPPALSALFEEPTVQAIADLLETGDPTDKSAMIALNAARDGAPLFCVCGIHMYAELARALPDNPVYGVYVPEERKLLEAAESPNETPEGLPTVEELAAAYKVAIRERQPSGPYHVAGLSFGGVLAYEIAQQLTAEGEQVQLVALFDSILPSSVRRDLGRWAMAHLRNLRKDPMTYLLRRRRVQDVMRRYPVAGQLLRRFERPAKVPAAPAVPPAQAEADNPMMAMFRNRFYIAAIRDYENRIRPYHGKTILFRALDQSLFEGYEQDRDAGWGELVPVGLELRDVPGDHVGILRGANAINLSEHLAPVLADVPSAQEGPKLDSHA